MSSEAPSIERRAISEDTLRRVYASDQDMYPAPLTFERLQSWVSQSQELSVSYVTRPGPGSDPAAAVGAVIVLPLTKDHWEKLLVGQVKEIEVDADAMFASSNINGLQDVGLHIFHIERFAGYDWTRPQRFAEFVLEDVREAARRQNWNILGYSALTATPAGRRVFDRMGFKPTGYEEHFAQVKNGTDTNDSIQMLFKYPGSEDTDSSKSMDSHCIIGKSEMVVKFD